MRDKNSMRCCHRCRGHCRSTHTQKNHILARTRARAHTHTHTHQVLSQMEEALANPKPTEDDRKDIEQLKTEKARLMRVVAAHDAAADSFIEVRDNVGVGCGCVYVTEGGRDCRKWKEKVDNVYIHHITHTHTHTHRL